MANPKFPTSRRFGRRLMTQTAIGNSVATIGVTIQNLLPALSLTAYSIVENAANTTIIGAVNAKSGSTVQLIDNAGNRFDLNSGNIRKAGTLNYDTAQTHTITLAEINAAYENSGRTTDIIINVLDFDNVAPTLSNPAATSTSTTTASLSVSTNEANGTLYVFVSTSSSAPTAANLKAGVGAVTYGSQAVTATGVQTFTGGIAGLTPGATYYSYFLHMDANSNNSAISAATSFTTPAGADTTAPVLTDPTASQSGSTSANLSVTTNESNGTIAWKISTTATLPVTSPVAQGTQSIFSTGTKTFAASGLSPSTLYYTSFTHTDAVGNVSTTVAAPTFTTPAAADTTAPTLSAQTDVAAGANGATLTVYTNEGNGTLYWYISTSATPPSATNLKAGTGATAYGSVAVASVGTKTINATGLSASTTYYAHFLQRDAATNDSQIVSGDGFATGAAADVTAPSISDPQDAATGSTSATISVVTNEANGVLYWFVSTNPATPTATNLKAGTGAAKFGTQNVVATGIQTVNVSTLDPSTQYYTFCLHRDAAGNDSVISATDGFITSAAADVVAPTLTAPQGTQTGQTTATLAVTTNEGNGTLYWYLSNSATPPSALNLKAGTGSLKFGSAGVAAANQRTVNVTGLSASTLYYTHFVHTDAAGNNSTIVSAAAFTTAAVSDPDAAPAYTALATATNTAPSPIAGFRVISQATDLKHWGLNFGNNTPNGAITLSANADTSHARGTLLQFATSGVGNCFIAERIRNMPFGAQIQTANADTTMASGWYQIEMTPVVGEAWFWVGSSVLDGTTTTIRLGIADQGGGLYRLVFSDGTTSKCYGGTYSYGVTRKFRWRWNAAGTYVFETLTSGSWVSIYTATGVGRPAVRTFMWGVMGATKATTIQVSATAISDTGFTEIDKDFYHYGTCTADATSTAANMAVRIPGGMYKGQTSVRLRWGTSDPGTSGGTVGTAVALTNLSNDILPMGLTGLTAATTYFYRFDVLNSSSAVVFTSRPYKFRTLPAAGSAVAFNTAVASCASQTPMSHPYRDFQHTIAAIDNNFYLVHLMGDQGYEGNGYTGMDGYINGYAPETEEAYTRKLAEYYSDIDLDRLCELTVVRASADDHEVANNVTGEWSGSSALASASSSQGTGYSAGTTIGQLYDRGIAVAESWWYRHWIDRPANDFGKLARYKHSIAGTVETIQLDLHLLRRDSKVIHDQQMAWFKATVDDIVTRGTATEIRLVGSTNFNDAVKLTESWKYLARTEYKEAMEYMFDLIPVNMQVLQIAGDAHYVVQFNKLLGGLKYSIVPPNLVGELVTGAIAADIHSKALSSQWGYDLNSFASTSPWVKASPVLVKSAANTASISLEYRANGTVYSFQPLAPDTTAPVLSVPRVAYSGPTTATVNVITNESNGTLYWAVTTSASPPTNTNLKNGTSVVAYGSKPITVAGKTGFAVTGLTASTTYYAHFLHSDNGGNETVLSSASFTTSATGDTATPVRALTVTRMDVPGSLTGAIVGDRGLNHVWRATNVVFPAAAATHTLWEWGGSTAVYITAAGKLVFRAGTGANLSDTNVAWADTPLAPYLGTTQNITWQVDRANNQINLWVGDTLVITASAPSGFGTLYLGGDIGGFGGARGTLSTDVPAVDWPNYLTTGLGALEVYRNQLSASTPSTIPLLSAGQSTQTGASTANITVYTNKDNGTLYWFLSSSSTAPGATALKAGTGGAKLFAGSQAVTAAGVQTLSLPALTPSTQYYTYLLHRDALGNDSVVTSAGTFTTTALPVGDTTPPTLSAATDVANGPNAANLSVYTNEDNGTIYWVVSASATAPTALQISQGKTANGNAAVANGSQAITSVGTKTFAASGLAAITNYTAHFVHVDAAGNNSNVISGDGFTTSSASYSFTNAEAAAYVGAMTVTPNNTRKGLIDTLIGGLKTDGVWAKLDWLLLLAAHDEQAGRLNAANIAKIATAVNTPTFTVDKGYAGDGVSQHLDLGESLQTGSNFTQSAASIGSWTNLGTANGASPFGNTASGANNRAYVLIPASGNETFRMNDTTSETFRASTGTAIGHRTLTREAVAIKRGYFNGSQVANLTTSSVSLGANTATVLRRAVTYSTSREAAYYSGGALTATEVLALHNRLNTYLTAIGAN